MAEKYVVDSRLFASYTSSSASSIPQVEDGLDAAKKPWPQLLPCLIQPTLRKSYLSLNMGVADPVKRIRSQGNQGAGRLIRFDM
jgi:hypothetical protein